MRGKRAKTLRRVAERVTVGKPARVHQHETRRKLVSTGLLNPDGTRQYVARDLAGTVRLKPNCTRAVYQRLKKLTKEILKGGLL